MKVYYLGHICTRLLDDFIGSPWSCESIFIKVNVPDCGKIMIFGIYGPPNISVNEFFFLWHYQSVFFQQYWTSKDHKI